MLQEINKRTLHVEKMKDYFLFEKGVIYLLKKEFKTDKNKLVNPSPFLVNKIENDPKLGKISWTNNVLYIPDEIKVMFLCKTYLRQEKTNLSDYGFLFLYSDKEICISHQWFKTHNDMETFLSVKKIC